MAEEPPQEVLPVQSAALGPGVSSSDPSALYADPSTFISDRRQITARATLTDPSESVYVDLDLGEESSISVVTLWKYPGIRYYSQTVEISNDGTFGESGTDDHTVAWTTGVGELGPEETLEEGNAIAIDPPVLGQYVRHRCGKNDVNDFVHFRGLEVRGTPAGEESAAAPEEGGEGATTMAPWSADDYGHAYWPNGWRKSKEDWTGDPLCFETGHYGLELDVNDLTKAKFVAFSSTAGGTADDATDGNAEAPHLSYLDVLDMNNRSRMDSSSLEEQELIIEVRHPDGTTYRAVNCLAGRRKDRSHARLWEAGRLVQNYELLDLLLKTDDGSTLKCNADLIVVSWPRSFSLTLKVNNTGSEPWTEGTILHLEFAGRWSKDKLIRSPWDPAMEREVSLECHVESSDNEGGGRIGGIALLMSGYRRVERLGYEPEFGCYIFKMENPHGRPFAFGKTDIRDYDFFDLTVENRGNVSMYVPFLFQLRPANITGVVPVLVLSDGVTPTGIPVQLSKNWHNKEMGAYVRAYALLPAPASSSQSFKLIFVYGFYGTLPSASHANLSLVGDSSNGRWEQLAIGCWGETQCLDVELSATKHCMITDSRALMVRAGAEGKMWHWTNAGWGGDWLGAHDMYGRVLLPRALKVGYVSQGPCLTEVQYGGYYGAFGGGGNAVRATFLHTVRTLRTDDYARMFYSLRYDVVRHLTMANPEGNRGQLGYFFRMGGSNWEPVVTPRVAVGNAEGLIEEYEIPLDAAANTFFIEDLELTGPGPWWVGYPGMNIREYAKGQAWRALVIQSYVVTAGDETWDKPVISLYVRKNHGGDAPNVDTLVRPPVGGTVMGSWYEAKIDVYWVTLPHNAVDYYGPNEALRAHLEEKPDSWETVFREAKGNSLQVEVTGGEVKENYPLIVRASTGVPEVRVDITGGVGAVPVRFEGLDGGSYQLYKASSKEDDGQCDTTPADSSRQVNYDAESFTYSVTYNIVLDGLDCSSWVLKK